MGLGHDQVLSHDGTSMYNPPTTTAEQGWRCRHSTADGFCGGFRRLVGKLGFPENPESVSAWTQGRLEVVGYRKDGCGTAGVEGGSDHHGMT